MVDAQEVVPGLLVGQGIPAPIHTMGLDLRGDQRCYLQEDAAVMLARAARRLHTLRPDLQLLAVDCARTEREQRRMWVAARGTAQQKLLANPFSGVGSLHTLGCAVDLALVDRDGRRLDFGEGVPRDLNQPEQEFEAYAKGALRAGQWANRMTLRLVMVEAGFRPISNEWWHFDCTTPREAWQRYPRIP